MMKKFNVWLLIFCTQSIIILVSFYLGFMKILVESDITNLGLFSILSFFILSLFVGFDVFREQFSKDYQWFVADAFLTVGMLGTIIGLILAFSTFPQLDFSDLASVKGIVSSIATGISTALYTTLVGLILSLFTKIQLVVLGDK